MSDSQPEAVFHDGETAIQERVGARAKMREIGPRVIRDHMPDQHREFFAQLPFVVVGALDDQAQPWASLLPGPPGFMRSPDAGRLVIGANPAAFDPLAGALEPGHAVGLLGIEPHTRRRNRMNGVIARRTAEGLEVAVSQSFGNCPKYIQARRPEFLGDGPQPGAVRRSGRLDAAAQALVRRADTFFIATAHPEADGAKGRARGVDVSHRGGKSGFVRVDDDGARLTVPDFVGNFFFNTLGNLTLNPRAGLLFVDFVAGDLLYVAARGTVIWDGPQVRAFAGAQRLVEFEVIECRAVNAALSLRWGAAEVSPFLAPTGNWETAAPA